MSSPKTSTGCWAGFARFPSCRVAVPFELGTRASTDLAKRQNLITTDRSFTDSKRLVWQTVLEQENRLATSNPGWPLCLTAWEVLSCWHSPILAPIC